MSSLGCVELLLDYLTTLQALDRLHLLARDGAATAEQLELADELRVRLEQLEHRLEGYRADHPLVWQAQQVPGQLAISDLEVRS